MGRADTPISIRFATDQQLVDIDDFAARHHMSRNAAITSLISYGLRHEREVMHDMSRSYEQYRPRGGR